MACSAEHEHCITIDAPADRQAALTAFFDSLEGEDGPTYYAYQTFVYFLTRARPALDGEFRDTFARIAQKLTTVAGDPVFIADGAAYISETLPVEFPELDLFGLTLEEAFVRSESYSDIFVETRRFADLRSLSRLRRELKKTRRELGHNALDVVKILLGLQLE
jgi:hypothetical protein